MDESFRTFSTPTVVGSEALLSVTGDGDGLADGEVRGVTGCVLHF